MLTEILFLILSLIIVVGAMKMLNAEELVHAVVYLGLVLGGVAGIYLTLGAEFLAAVQVLIYVGAVVTLILFAVMLTTPATHTEGFAEDKTPLSVLGIEGPRGMDVESLTEVPDDVASVSEAEAAAGAAAEEEAGGEGADEVETDGERAHEEPSGFDDEASEDPPTDEHTEEEPEQGEGDDEVTPSEGEPASERSEGDGEAGNTSAGRDA